MERLYLEASSLTAGYYQIVQLPQRRAFDNRHVSSLSRCSTAFTMSPSFYFIFLSISIATVCSLAVSPAQSKPQIPSLASLLLAGRMNLTSISSVSGNPRQRLLGLEAECSERAFGRPLKTSAVQAAFDRIPDDPAPRVFSWTPSGRAGAVNLPARIHGTYSRYDTFVDTFISLA